MARSLVFIGDSITSGWSSPWRGRPVQRSYFPGATFAAYPGHRPEYMLAQFDDGGLGVVEGAVAVVMAGVNSMTRDARPADIAHEVGRLAARIGGSAGRVILLSILPATVWGRNEWPRIRATNGLLASVPGVRWVDVAAAFLDGERVAGRMVTDGVHLTMRGYVTLARQIAPVLVEEGALEPVRPPAALGGWLAAAGIRDALRRTLRPR